MTAGLEAEVAVVRDAWMLELSLVAAPGEVVVLVGPNGAGKTTLLRALAGLEPLTAGSVMLDGEVLEDVAAGVSVAPEHRRVGVVFQEHLLFPHLSVLENVAFGPRSRGVPRGDARRRAAEWLERVGLAHRSADRPARLSGGESQRVALARALATEPRMLLLDEPFAALDVTTRAEVRRQLRSHLRSFDGVRLLVTHDPVEAMAFGDRLVVLEQGRVVQRGTATELSTRPRSTYVADLVGVNLLRGEASGDRVVVGGGASSLVAATHATGAVFVVVHPRAVALHRRRPEGTPRNVWQGTVTSVDREEERVRVRVAGTIPIVSEVTAAAVADLALAPGVGVWVSVKAAEVSVHPA